MTDLTIIIPHYNTHDLLKKLLDTIPVYDNIQTIVIDDKSDSDIVKLHALRNDAGFNHVAFLDNTTDKKGAGVCRNIGLESAGGEWVLFADADDFFTENFYSKIEKYFKSENDVVFFMPTSVILGKNTSGKRHVPYCRMIENYIKAPDKSNELKIRYSFPVPWSKLIRRALIKRNDVFFDEILVSNDVMFSAKVGHYMTKFEISTETIYCATSNSGSLTKRLNEKNFDIRFSAFIKLHGFLKEMLSENNFKLLGLSGAAYLYLAFVYRLRLKKMLEIITKMKKNKIKIFEVKRDLNPFLVVKKILVYGNK